jgi:hypothetical protein
MKKYNTLELLTGFLMGSIAGVLIEWAIIYSYNLVCRLRGSSVFVADWWMLIPIPVISGIIMARAIASLHLEDY